MSIIKFLFYSILGIIAFLAPVTIGGESSILMGHIKSIVIDGYSESIKYLIVFVSLITITGTIIGKIKKQFKNPVLQELFICGPINGAVRIGGSIFFLMVHFGVGPKAVLDPNTGGNDGWRFTAISYGNFLCGSYSYAASYIFWTCGICGSSYCSFYEKSF